MNKLGHSESVHVKKAIAFPLRRLLRHRCSIFLDTDFPTVINCQRDGQISKQPESMNVRRSVHTFTTSCGGQDARTHTPDRQSNVRVKASVPPRQTRGRGSALARRWGREEWELGERGPRRGGHRSLPLLFTPAENGCLH